jgi:glycerophosphoryl diester phosphodiesterase
MKFYHKIESGIQALLDAFYSLRPQPIPDEAHLKNCKIVSHRGEYDNQIVFENTLAAFDKAKAASVWGIECDLRWTKDLQPVVIHDSDLLRVFDLNVRVCEVKLSELKSACSLVPCLGEVIQRYGKRLHLMLEIKTEVYPDPEYQNQVLADALSSLKPGQDFHILTMSPQMFKVIDFVDPSAFIAVARFNILKLSKLARQENYGGLAGHYFFLTKAILRKHHDNQQKVGTGYIGSKNCLFRELNRGIEWLFSNNAAELQELVDGLLMSYPTGNLQNPD